MHAKRTHHFPNCEIVLELRTSKNAFMLCAVFMKPFTAYKELKISDKHVTVSVNPKTTTIFCHEDV